MALTATAQSALREPVWDEVIVPTLRKRLQNESNVLARRISAASVGSTDDHADLYQSTASLSSQDAITPPTQHPHQHQGAVHRPNTHQSQTDSQTSYTQYSQPPSSRARSLSQPYLFDSTAHVNMVAGSSVTTPPMLNGKATRIPVSRGRQGSASSHAQNSINSSVGKAEGSNELRSVDEGHETYQLRSTVRIPRHKGPDLFDEAPPFGAPSSTSSHFHLEDETLGRVSSESEERPFEHWYRGDVSRNGGVGELRVGRRTEMLDIANYGHTFRSASSRIVHDGYQRSRSNSRSRDLSTSRYDVRPRAESIGATARQGTFLDEDELTAQDSMVMDEQPPADTESDGYDELAEPYDHHPNGTVSTPSLALQSQNEVGVAPRHRLGQVSQSRIPTASSHRQPSLEPRTPTPTSITRGTSAFGTPSSTSSTPRARQLLPRSQTQPLQQAPRQKIGTSSTSAAKRRAVSPATSTLNSAKKSKANSKPPSSMQKITKKDENRRSIGQYPTPDGDDVVDAIPSWTQPIPPSGNWDDVVLPVVARKKGLEGHYATADGSPKPPQQTNEYVFEPAPGTFGFDHSKYRRNPDAGANDIPLDEFGQKVRELNEEWPVVDKQLKPQPPATLNLPSSTLARSRPSPPPSPPPFAQYSSVEHQQLAPPAQPHLHPLPVEIRTEKPIAHDDDAGGGCCRCVIM